MSDTRPVLYSYFRSSASYRVRIGLALKGIDYDYRAVHLVEEGGAQYKAAYAAVNPMHEVPSLVIDGHTLSQSLPILEYLDETRPTPPLLPADAYGRAKARQLAECVNASIQPVQNLRVLKKLEADFGAVEETRRAWVAHFIHSGFRGIEAILRDTAGSFAVGDAVSLADICLVPQVFAAGRFGVTLEAYPTLAAVAAKAGALPAFEAAHPSRQPDAQ
jgi:maleylacetoacetate isomerase